MTPRSARIPTQGTIEGGGRGRQDGKGDDPKRGGKRGGACQAWTARALARAGREPGKASGSDERMAHGRRGWLVFDGAHIAEASNATCLPSAITLATSCDPLQANEREGLQLRSRREERRQCAWSGRDRTGRTRAITVAHSRTLVWLRPAACQADHHHKQGSKQQQNHHHCGGPCALHVLGISHGMICHLFQTCCDPIATSYMHWRVPRVPVVYCATVYRCLYNISERDYPALPSYDVKLVHTRNILSR